MSNAISIAESFTLILNSRGLATDNFPRDLEMLVSHGLEIPIVYQRNLSIQQARSYICALSGSIFAERGGNSERLILGLLHIGPPSNIILVRAGLPQHIVNYVIAHEVGHFLADVFSVQQLWHKFMPEQQTEITKAFQWQEFNPRLELRAFLKGLPDRPSEITGRGEHIHEDTSDREILADLIARELIAPWELTKSHYRHKTRTEFAQTIKSSFGLPLKVAADYYDDLKRYMSPRPDLVDRMFSPLIERKNRKFFDDNQS
ncbi:MAG: hypothetical protein K8L97_31205 [Anaerolineae bacterium]|nr:hypothetical protein [Anaerolineae bacterium]